MVCDDASLRKACELDCMTVAVYGDVGSTMENQAFWEEWNLDKSPFSNGSMPGGDYNVGDWAVRDPNNPDSYYFGDTSGPTTGDATDLMHSCISYCMWEQKTRYVNNNDNFKAP